jgi:ubiquinol-cytochrome c reductase iron-sulfur subunit
VSEPRRRDLLTTVAFATAGVGSLFALYPFIAALGPAQDTLAQRVTFDGRELITLRRATLAVRGEPVLVFHRTPDKLAELRNAKLPNKTRDPHSPTGYAFRDRDSEFSVQPALAKNWHRSLRVETMVCSARCTREGCVLMRPRDAIEDLRCPCCGSLFDLAGRAIKGPAPKNLPVPPHRYLDDHTIEFLETSAS